MKVFWLNLINHDSLSRRSTLHLNAANVDIDTKEFELDDVHVYVGFIW